jgi:hypothetical protein
MDKMSFSVAGAGSIAGAGGLASINKSRLRHLALEQIPH